MRAPSRRKMLAALMDAALGLAMLVGLALTAGAILVDTRQRLTVFRSARRDPIDRIALHRAFTYATDAIPRVGDLPDPGR